MMTLLEATRRGDPLPAAGTGLFVALMTAGYYYNVTLVQLGVIDMGRALVGLRDPVVSVWMGALAVVTVVAAVATGWRMDRAGWGISVRRRLRVLLAVVAVQTVLTAVAPAVSSPAAFAGWVLACGLTLGVGFPVSVSLGVALVPVPDRGPVAALVTALVYLLANAVPLEWSMPVLSGALLGPMVAGTVVLAVVVSGRVDRVEALLDGLEAAPPGGDGRFVRSRSVGLRTTAFWAPVALLFGIFFVDSLGFLRIIDTPALLGTSWGSPNYTVRLAIGVAHVVGAALAGVLYVGFGRRAVFGWTVALFALTHVAYTTDLRLAAAVPGLVTRAGSPLNPALYAVAVSFYTTLNFALWPDLSTPETAGLRCAVGIGVAGWLATFLSTATALVLDASATPLVDHLTLVQALALLLVVVLAVTEYGRGVARAARTGGRP